MARRSRQLDKDWVKRRSVFGRRALMLGGLQAAGVGALGYRYYSLQVRDHDKHRRVAENNTSRQQTLEPKRGRIFDRFGEELAGNTSGFQANFTPQNNGRDSLTLVRLFEILRMNDADIAAFTERLVRNDRQSTIVVAEDIDRDAAVAVDSELLNLPGVDVIERDTRVYPFGATAAHVVGYVRSADAGDLGRDDDPLLRLPGFKVGQAGVEGTMDRTLRGGPGVREDEIDAHGNRIREIRRVPPQTGADLALSIDIGLQQSVLDRLRASPDIKEGAVVVMNVHTGEVLASVSYPTYDPNGFVGRIDPDWYRQVRDDAYKPQFNRVMSAHYPPASTYKMLPLLAALESGKFTTDHQVTCQGFYDVGENEEGEYRRRFRCWQRQGHGTLSMSDALKESCDVYLYDLVAGEQGLGHEETIAVARRFGLGEQLCMDLIGETPGTVPDETYKLQKYGDGWRTGDSINHSIGQGFWETTPLQLATMMSRLVNGGYAVQPYYVQPNVPYVWPQIDIAAENLTHIRKAMESVTLDRNGTAYKARIKVAGMEMAGKTGTAQVKSLEGGSEEPKDCFIQDYSDREHSLFLGYAPVDQPRYACAVIIEHGCSGSSTAAPIARDILTVAQSRGSALTGASMPNRPSLRTIAQERKRAEEIARSRAFETSREPEGETESMDPLDVIPFQSIGLGKTPSEEG